jgi:transcription antitermination factor NusG
LGVDYENVLKKFEQNKEKKEIDNNVKKIKSISNEVLFEIGDKIEVISGVWKSTVGEVIKSDNKKKSVLIEVELLGGKRTVSILMKNCKRI